MKILFVCTGNTCRSCMAEGIAKNIAKHKDLEIEICSAGLYAVAGDCASTNAINVMKDMNINISDHYASHLENDIIQESDLILTMTLAHKAALLSAFPSSKGKVFTLLEYVDMSGDIVDPFGGDISVYKSCANQLKQAIDKLFLKLGEE